MFKEIRTNTDPRCFALFWRWLDRFIESCAMSTWPRSNKCSATWQNSRTQNASHHPEEISTVISCQAVLCQHSEENMQHHTQQKESTLTHLPLSTLLTGVDGRIEAYPWLKPPDTITLATNWSPFSTRKLKNDMINFMYVYMNYIPCVLPKHYIYIWLHSIYTFRYRDMWL